MTQKLGGIIIAFLLLFTCAKIDDFTSPNLNETFSGQVAIIPFDSSKFKKVEAHIISLNGDGKTVYINNATGLCILPLQLECQIKVCGLIGEPLDKNTIKINGFASIDESSCDYNTYPTVSGTIQRNGANLNTLESDPIVIKQKLKIDASDATEEKIIYTILLTLEITTVL